MVVMKLISSLLYFKKCLLFILFTILFCQMDNPNLNVSWRTQVNFSKRQMNIGDEGLNIICQQQTHHIVELKLRCNSLTVEGIIRLKQAKWDNLTMLYLTQNFVGDKGCKHLSQAHFPKIKELALGRNIIGNIGALHLSKASWRTLQQIYLFHNKMNLESVRALIKANWHSLKIIAMQKNFHMIFQALYLALYSGDFIKQIRINIDGGKNDLRCLISMLTSKYPKHNLTLT